MYEYQLSLNALLDNPNGLLFDSKVFSQPGSTYRCSPTPSPNPSNTMDSSSFSRIVATNIQDLQLGSAGHGPLPLMSSDPVSSSQSFIFMNMNSPSPSSSSSQVMREVTMERSTNSSTHLGKFLQREQVSITGIPNLSSYPVLSSSSGTSRNYDIPSFDERTSYNHSDVSNDLEADMNVPLLSYSSLLSSSSSHSYMKPDELTNSGSNQSHSNDKNEGNDKYDDECNELSRSVDLYSTQDEYPRHGRHSTQFGSRMTKPIGNVPRGHSNGQPFEPYSLPASSYTPSLVHAHGSSPESPSPTHRHEIINDLISSQPM